MANPFTRRKSLEELQEEDEYKEVELSIAEKKAAIKELQRRGQNPNDFKDGKGGKLNFSKIIAWLKTH